MALDISATDTELQKPINAMFQQSLLRNARPLAPYFMGTVKGQLVEHGGTATAKWRRIENLTPTTSALSELTGTAAYGQSRDSESASFTDVLATVDKYGQYYILNEEADLFNFNGQSNKLVETLAISAGRSLNMVTRNEYEDNATAIYANSDSDGGVNTIIAADDLALSINTLVRNSVTSFTPMTRGSTNVGTAPILPSLWGICHPDIAYDISRITGFKSVETYAGQVETVMGEFGFYGLAGKGIRFVQTEDASIDTDVGATSGQDVRETTNSKADLYNTVIYGQDAVGTLGLGQEHPDGIYRSGDPLSSIKLLASEFGKVSPADPYGELMTLGWKTWHVPKILNTDWVRRIRSAATNLSN